MSEVRSEVRSEARSDHKLKDYPDITYLSREQLDSNNSLTKILAFVGSNKRVIDFGCATGYLAKLLAEQDCKTVGVEINPEAAKAAEQFCEQVTVADLDYEDVVDIVGEQKFDVAVFGDVLEHLKDPWRVLKAAAGVLSPEGYVVASIPNVAHGAVRLALLAGHFDYEELGLLDNTHLRFFTHDSLGHLFESSGYCIESEDRTTLPVFGDSPLTPALERLQVSDELVETIAKDEFSDCLQFVVRAYPYSTSYGHIALQKKCCELQRSSKKAQTELQQTQAELQQIQAESQQIQAELQQTQAELQQTQVELQQIQAESQQIQAESQQIQAESQQAQSALQQIIQSMETSKFWRLRKVWFKLKRKLPLKVDE